jgi:hypothetical protein
MSNETCEIDSHRCAFFRATLNISMQRGFAIALTLMFGWLLVLPAFAASSGLTAPQCCRKNGKHHCQMHVAHESDSGPAFSSIAEKCPCCPHATFALQAHSYIPSIAGSIYAALIQHPGVSPQTEANYRVSYDRSRQKRGPPLTVLL